MEGPGSVEMLPDFPEPPQSEEPPGPYELPPERRLRVNTVRVDLSRLSHEPCPYQLQEFVAIELEVQPDDLCRLQWSRKQRCLFLKMRNQAVAEQLVGAHSGRHRFPTGPHRPRIVLTLEDGTTDVLLHDLSELVDELDVHNFLGQYGLIQSVSATAWGCDMRYAGVDNGQLVVRMVVRHPIPRIVRICGEETRVTYEGQPEPQSSLLAGLSYVAQRCLAGIRGCFNGRA